MGAKKTRTNKKRKIVAFFLIDMGKNLAHLGSVIEAELRKDGHHIVVYLTDMPTLLCIEEITEDQFLDHFKKTKYG